MRTAMTVVLMGMATSAVATEVPLVAVSDGVAKAPQQVVDAESVKDLESSDGPSSAPDERVGASDGGAFQVADEPSPAPDVLEVARTHLESGELDEVLLTLEGAELPPAQLKEGASVLADAASDALDRHDHMLALALAEAALQNDPKEVLGLASAARASLNLRLFGPAKEYIRRFVALRSRSPMARLLLAEDAYVDHQWNQTLKYLRGLNAETFSEMDALRIEELWHHSERELAERRAERQILSAAPKRARYRPSRTQGQFRQHVRPERVVRRRSCGR